MRHAPNSVYPFQELKLGKRVVFWKILCEHYDSVDDHFQTKDSDFKYCPSDFDDVSEDLLKIARRHLDLGYCPAVPLNQTYSSSGVTCVIHDKWSSDY